MSTWLVSRFSYYSMKGRMLRCFEIATHDHRNQIKKCWDMCQATNNVKQKNICLWDVNNLKCIHIEGEPFSFEFTTLNIEDIE